MKKTLSLLLALLLALTVSVFAAADDLTGEWFLTEVSYGEQAFSPAMLGMEFTLTLKADGTMVLVVSDESTEGTWTVSGSTVTLTVEGDPLVCTYDGVSIRADVEGMGMKFERSGALSAPAGTGMPETVAAADISAFDGDWVVVKVCSGGTYMELSMLIAMGADPANFEDMAISVSNGLVTPAKGNSLQFELIDGELRCTKSGEDIVLRMYADGTIELSMPSTDTGFVFGRAQAAQNAA